MGIILILKKHACDECGKTFKYRSGLYYHQSVGHKGKHHVCHICGSEKVSKQTLDKHLKGVHNMLGGFKMCDICNRYIKESPEAHAKKCLKLHKCPHCDMTYKISNSLAVHIKNYHGEKKPSINAQCECSKIFKSKDLLKRHQLYNCEKNSADQMMVCPECNKSLKKCSYHKHKRYSCVFSKCETFKCPKCNKVIKCRSKSELKKHIAICN